MSTVCLLHQPHLILLLLLLLLSIFSAANGLTASNTSIPGCPSFDCGDGVQVVYPFWIADPAVGDDLTAFCGYQDYMLTCNGTRPWYSKSWGSYALTAVNNRKRTYRLVEPDVAGSSCPRATHNATPGDLAKKYGVGFTTSVVFLVFLFDCNLALYKGPSLPPATEEITCLANVSGTSYALYAGSSPELPAQYRGLPVACAGGSVVSPVMAGSVSSRDAGTAFPATMRGGFEMHWSELLRIACRKCQDSGGWCGYNNRTGDGLTFRCFCMDGVHSGDCKDQDTHPTGKSSSKKGLKIGIGIGVTVGALLCLIVAACGVRKLRAASADGSMEANLASNVLLRRYDYSKMKQMTSSFNEQLGKGGYGTVYKGKLPDGTPVAVKLLTKSKRSTGEEEDFLNEVVSIGRTNHINVVGLLGFCERPRRALVYEFMPNGSLDRFLFHDDMTLDWEKLLGIARGLEYLHGWCNTQIVHFDIKPHNILLDGELRPKISDFGLARPRGSVSPAEAGSARGTAGYIAPEIFSRSFGDISSKSDVYSYGMMLLEMAGRRKNVKFQVENVSEIYFPHWIYEHLDERYGLEECRGSMENEIARKMVLVGLWCIQMDPNARPSIGRVVEMLEGGVGDLEMPPKPGIYSPTTSEGRRSISDFERSHSFSAFAVSS